MLCFGVFLTSCPAHLQEEDSWEVGKIRNLLAAAQESTSFHTRVEKGCQLDGGRSI